MENRTLDELKQIAIDIYKGLIFTDRHCRGANEIQLSFAILNFMDDEQWNQFTNNPPGLLFEYFDKAAPRRVNGLPVFFSLHMLSKDDAKIVLDTYKKLEAAEQKMLENV